MTSVLRKKTVRLTLSALAALSIVACQMKDSNTASSGDTTPPSDTTSATPTPNTAGAAETEGWNGALVDGVEHYVIQIKVKASGHYETTKNRCRFQADFGAIPLEEWNRLVKAMNMAIKSPPPTSELCVKLAQGSYGMDDKAYLLIGPTEQKKLLFEMKPDSDGSKLACTIVIGDRQLAQDAADMLNRISIRGAYEGCPDRPPLN